MEHGLRDQGPGGAEGRGHHGPGSEPFPEAPGQVSPWTLPPWDGKGAQTAVRQRSKEQSPRSHGEKLWGHGRKVPADPRGPAEDTARGFQSKAGEPTGRLPPQTAGRGKLAGLRQGRDHSPGVPTGGPEEQGTCCAWRPGTAPCRGSAPSWSQPWTTCPAP